MLAVLPNFYKHKKQSRTSRWNTRKYLCFPLYIMFLLQILYTGRSVENGSCGCYWCWEVEL